MTLSIGVDADDLYDGDSKAIGDFFKKVKAGERPLARWAVTTLLSIAPDEAVQSCAIRGAIQKMVLSAPQTFTWQRKGDAPIDGLPLPSLKRFNNLDDLTIAGFAITDLSCIMGNASVRVNKLERTAPILASLNGLCGFAECANNSSSINAPHFRSLERRIGDPKPY